VIAPELRVDRAAMTKVLGAADRSTGNLLAFPAQSNFSGVQHPLDLVEEAHEAGWDVLVDAAAFAPTNRFDVARIRPDFVSISYYKIIGYPTGIGCLLVRRDRLESLTRPWFSGGTVTIASVLGDGHYLRPDAAAFEDGTVDYLNLPAVADGLRHIEGIRLDSIHHRVRCLTQWLLEAMNGLRHNDGRRVIKIHGPTDMTDRGGTVTFLVRDRDGRVVSERRIEELANRANISLRTGCFCNPGASEVAHDLGGDEITKWFGREEPVWPQELREGLWREHDRVLAAVRISVGVATNFADIYRMMCFLQGFVDRTVDEIERADFTPTSAVTARSSRVTERRIADGKELHAAAVNEHQARVAAGITMALGATAFVYANFDKLFWPIRAVSAFFFIDFLIRVTTGLERSPSGLVAGWMTRWHAPQWVSAKPKRFAWTLGGAMALAMTVITNSGIHGPLPRTICLICLTLMWMEAVLGLSLGCEIYGLMVRRGWRAPDDAFEICPDGACDLHGLERQQRTA
jgi:selenocysteine lyase/cysteine desulfurase